MVFYFLNKELFRKEGEQTQILFLRMPLVQNVNHIEIFLKNINL